MFGDIFLDETESLSHTLLYCQVLPKKQQGALLLPRPKRGRYSKFLIKCLIFQCLLKVNRFTNLFTLYIAIKIILCKNNRCICLVIEEEIKQNNSFLYIALLSSQHKLGYFLGLKSWRSIIHVWKGHF